ncbi:MAG: beta strand repeat-containing protein [Chthoniobacterales bacterium]
MPSSKANLKKISLILVSALVVASSSIAEETLRNKPDPTVVTNGPVQAVVRAGDTIYIGGHFDRVGPRTGPGVEVGLDGSRDPGLPEISGAGPSSLVGSGGGLSAVAADGFGGWYIGGLFTHVGGVPRTNLAHILADHSVDPSFHPDVNDAVHVIALSGSTIYAAGLFTSIGGQSRNNIAALDTADGSVKAFNPNANAAVEALAVSSDGSILYAGGRFTVIGGQPRIAIAALTVGGPLDGTATPTFNPTATGTGPGIVDALAVSGSTLYVGGTFNTIGGQPRNNIAALSLGLPLDGVAVPAFNPSPSYRGCAACASIGALAISGSTLYVGGLFDTIGGQPRKYLAGLNTADGMATAFDPEPNGNIFALAILGSTVYVAGSFNSRDGSPTIGGQARNYAAALNLIDGTASAFNPNPNASVVGIAVSGSAIYLGGYFSSLGGVVRRSIAAINALDGTATNWDPGARGANGNDGLVYALAVSGSTVYVGGFFTSIGGQPRVSIAAINVADGFPTKWDPSANYNGGTGSVTTLATAGPTIYAGGAFNSIGGQTRNSIAAIDATDGTATTWNPNPNSEVAALMVSGNLVYVGGYFTAIGGQTRNKIAALNASDGNATTWDPDATANANVLALAMSGSTIYAGGDFTTIHGVPRRNIAGINTSDGTPTSFDPEASDPTTGGGVFALAVSGSTVYAAGFFSTIGGQPRNLLAGLNAGDGSATSFDPNGAPGFGAFALAVAADGTLYAGGSFDTFDLAYQQGFAQFSPQIKLLSAVSVKTHGNIQPPFPIDLPLAGQPGIECRSGGATGDYQVVFAFLNSVSVTGTPQAQVTSGTGQVGTGGNSNGGVVSINGQTVTVPLTNVANAQKITVTLNNVSDGTNIGSVSVPMGVLLGDTNGDGSVSGADVTQTKAQAGNLAHGDPAANFREDVTTDGSISGADVTLVKRNAGNQLP